VYIANSTQPAADAAAEVAASFAAAAVLFGDTYGAAYTAQLVRRAKQLYAFANAYPSIWSGHPYLAGIYPGGSFRDDILWASVWLCKLDSSYCSQAHSNWANTGGSSVFDWENVHAAATALLLSISGTGTSTQRASYQGERCWGWG
jgi:hypothetical protein